MYQYVYGYAVVRLGDIATIKTGSKPKDFSGIYEYINAGTTNSGYTSKFNCVGDVVTTPSRGQGGIGYIGYQKNNFWLGPLCYQIRANDDYNIVNKFIYYVLKGCSGDILSNMKVGGTPAINKIDIAQIKIPLPPLEEQQRIVDILDRFDKICNDISEGLPAEIEARQKQYEYYREKLLTFENIENN